MAFLSMNERQMQFRVGVVMFATLIIGALLATLNGPVPKEWLPWGRQTYRIAIQLPQAPGVGPNTPVRKNGLLIGRVASIDDLDNGVILHANIDGDRRLLTSHVPHVRTSVLGDATIDFVSSRTDAPPQPLADGAKIPGVVDPNPFDALAQLADLKTDFAEASRSLGNAGDEVAKLARRVNDAFGSETETGRVDRLLDTTEDAMAQFGQTMGAINEILGDEPIIAQSPVLGQPAGGQQILNRQPLPNDPRPSFDQQPPTNGPPPANVQPPVDGREMRQRIRQGLNELPEAIREMRITMEQFRVVLDSANKNFQNLEGFTEPLGRRGEEIATSVVDAVDGLDRLVEEFTVLSQALNSREGTLGQLIQNPQLYENLNRLVHNANQVVVQINDLTLKLRPVVDDARVFMDKVAREPGRVVTGGLNPSLVK
jgi:phospholipid/cholesterol/gamma-HCH transport system substrate-binding protein